MSYRPRLVLILGLLILLTLALSACNRERPVTTTTTTTPAAARGTVAAPTPGGAGTEAAPGAGGTVVAAPTPSAPSPQQVVVSPAPSAAGASGESFSYTVAAGDTLATIAARFNTTPDAIAQLNGLADPNALTQGQKLQIPGAAAAAGTAAGGTGAGSATTGGAASSATTTYTVQKGDMLSAIAKRFGTTVAAIVAANNLTNPDSLKIGQRLIIPGGGGASSGGASSGGAAVAVPTSGQGRSYVVQRGDTLLSIARRFGLTVKQIQQANNITNPDRISVGQTLVIP